MGEFKVIIKTTDGKYVSKVKEDNEREASKKFADIVLRNKFISVVNLWGNKVSINGVTIKSFKVKEM